MTDTRTDTLGLRRQELLARCAEQRIDLALEVQELRSAQENARPLAMSALAVLGARLLANKRLALGVAGAGLGLALLRPARLLRVVRLAASGWRVAQNGIALAARFRR